MKNYQLSAILCSAFFLTPFIVNGEAIQPENTANFFIVEPPAATVVYAKSEAALKRKLKTLDFGSAELYRTQAQIYRVQANNTAYVGMSSYYLDSADRYDQRARDAAERENRKSQRDEAASKAKALEREKEAIEAKWRIEGAGMEVGSPDWWEFQAKKKGGICNVVSR